MNFDNLLMTTLYRFIPSPLILLFSFTVFTTKRSSMSEKFKIVETASEVSQRSKAYCKNNNSSWFQQNQFL